MARATSIWLIGLSLFVSVSLASAGDDRTTGPWERVRNDAGIEVYRRTVAGSQLHEFQGTGVIEAPIPSVLAVLDDVEHRTEWMKEAVAQTLISRNGDREQTFYSRTGAPWPVSDRDAVIKAITTVDVRSKMVKVEMNSIDHPAWPPQKGVVRMPSLRGHWYLWPSNGGKWTRVEYQVHADPGGSLPSGIINMVSKKIPHSAISEMQKQVVRRKYPAFEAKIAQMPEYKDFVQTMPGLTAPVPVAGSTTPAAPAQAATPAQAAEGTK